MENHFLVFILLLVFILILISGIIFYKRKHDPFFIYKLKFFADKSINNYGLFVGLTYVTLAKLIYKDALKENKPYKTLNFYFKKAIVSDDDNIVSELDNDATEIWQKVYSSIPDEFIKYLKVFPPAIEDALYLLDKVHNTPNDINLKLSNPNQNNTDETITEQQLINDCLVEAIDYLTIHNKQPIGKLIINGLVATKILKIRSSDQDIIASEVKNLIIDKLKHDKDFQIKVENKFKINGDFESIINRIMLSGSWHLTNYLRNSEFYNDKLTNRKNDKDNLKKAIKFFKSKNVELLKKVINDMESALEPSEK